MEQLTLLGVKPLTQFSNQTAKREKKKKSKEIVIIEIETHSCILKFSDLTLRFWFWCRDLVLWNNRVTCIGCYSWKDKVLFRLTGTRVHHYLLHPFLIFAFWFMLYVLVCQHQSTFFGYFLKYRSSQVLRFFIQSLENQLVLLWRTWSWVAGSC